MKIQSNRNRSKRKGGMTVNTQSASFLLLQQRVHIKVCLYFSVQDNYCCICSWCACSALVWCKYNIPKHQSQTVCHQWGLEWRSRLCRSWQMDVWWTQHEWFFPLRHTRTSPSPADESLHRCDKSIGRRNNGQQDTSWKETCWFCHCGCLQRADCSL